MGEIPDGAWAAGGEIDEVHIALRVAGDELDPGEVSRLLGVEPSFSARKGETHERDGSVVEQPTGVWVLDLAQSAEWELEDGVRALLARLPGAGASWDVLAGRYRIEVFCGLFLRAWNRGFALSPALLGELSSRQLTFSADVYCAADDADDDAHDDDEPHDHGGDDAA